MLVGVTRIGSLRQRVAKGFAVTGGVDPGRPGEAIAAGPAPVTIGAAAGRPGLWHVTAPLTWLGSPDSRAQWWSGLARALVETATRVEAAGGALLPTGVPAGTGHTTPSGDDLHVIEVASNVEQEVLCNLLREQVPLLVALTGRSGPTGSAGSRRLAGSREHVAARYLASTSSHHLARVAAELRRVDGIAQLSRMDVFPSTEPDGTLTVTVRCVDAAASLATARAHALLLAAFGLRARRLVRDGRRLGHLPQRHLEENRARAIARGLRARLAPAPSPGMPGHDGGAATTAPHPAPARDLLRSLLVDSLANELDNLGATPEELFAVIAPLDLPEAGLAHVSTDDDLLGDWAANRSAHEFTTIATHVLRDAGAGGPTLAAATRVAPGRTRLVLDEWTAAISARHRGDRRPEQVGAGS